MAKKIRTYVDLFVISLKKFFKTDFGIVLLIVLTWQIMMTLFGYVIDISTHNFNPAFTNHPSGLLSHTWRWDAGWYLNVINNFYVGGNPAAPAFYPLFPLAVKSLYLLFFGQVGLLVCGFIINTVASWLAIVALIRIVRHFTKDKQTPWLVVGLFIASPAAIFLHLFYGEALFIALGFWAYYFALMKKWSFVGILLFFALLARLPAVTFVALCGLEYLRSFKWNMLKATLNKNFLWFLLTPLSLVSYGAYLYVVRGDFLAMQHAYHATDDWTYYIFNPNIFQTIRTTAGQLHSAYFLGHLDTGSIVNQALPLFGLLILFASSLYAIIAIKKHGIPLGIFGIMSIIMFTINSHMISAHRYLLPCIVIFIAAAVLIEKYRAAKFSIYPVIYTSILIQAYLLFCFINNYFAG